MLSQIKTRSEFRKSGGLVKINSGEINRRTLILDAEWASPEDSEPSEGEGEGEEIVDFCGNDGDDEDEEEDEDEESDDKRDQESDDEEQEDESEDELPLPPSTRKRPGEPLKGTTAPPKKRVTFDLQDSAKVAGLLR